jgi:peptidoglycan hydrolase-like protein with peptidoglycan-binding domain
MSTIGDIGNTMQMVFKLLQNRDKINALIAAAKPYIEMLQRDIPAIAPQVKELLALFLPAGTSTPQYDVRWVQDGLNQFDLGLPKLVVDGDMGPKTHEAISAFQTKFGLTADGWMGPLTAAKLDAELKKLTK